MNPLLPMIPTALDKEMAKAKFLEIVDLFEEMRRAQRTARCILDPRQGLALWARIGIFSTELDHRAGMEFAETDPAPTPWRVATSSRPDADEAVLAVNAASGGYAIAIFEESEDGRGGVWLDAEHFQPVRVTHWMPLIGILEPPTMES